jgi:hypothetical protein
MAGSDGIFCGGFPIRRWGLRFARYLGYRYTRQLGDYFLARGRHPSDDPPAVAAVPPDRPGFIRSGFVAEHRRLRPRHRD